MGTTNIYGAGAQIATNLSGVSTNVNDIDALEAGVTVEVNTTGDTGDPNILLITESRLVLSGEHAGEMQFNTLPLAVAGATFTFIVNDGNGMRIVANTSDTIRLNGQISIAAGYVESTVVGSVIVLVAIDDTEWIATSVLGTWLLETS